MIARLLAWLGITPIKTGYEIHSDIEPGGMMWRTVYSWRCYECRSGTGVAPSYEVALNAAQTHQRTQHGEVSA